MFDFAWSEFGLIAVVALIMIGPKDMPVAIRALTAWIKKARRMAAEFQTHVDEMVREADLHEVRSTINEIRNFDIKGEIERTVDADGSIRDAFTGNPLETAPTVAAVEEIAVAERAPEDPPPEPVAAARVQVVTAPAFVPPNVVAPHTEQAAATAPEPPAFIPPGIARERRPRLS